MGHNGDHKSGVRLRRVIAVITIAVVTMGPGYGQLDLCRRQRLSYDIMTTEKHQFNKSDRDGVGCDGVGRRVVD